MAEKEKPQVNPEKLKVLSAVMDKIEKDFGKGAIMKMSDRAVDKVPVIPSGSVTIDHALGMLAYELHGACSPLRQSNAVYEHPALLRAKIAGKNAAQRGLSRTARRRKRHALPFVHRERESVIQRSVSWVGEANIESL